MNQKEFTNENRTRYYGLRVGDIVKTPYQGRIAEVIAYSGWDNNRVDIRFEDGSETDVVAEWCEIVKKVEDE